MTFNKKWLQQTIAEIEEIRDEIPFGLGEHDSNMLEALKIALAALTAEPVMYAMIKGGEFDSEMVSDCDYVVDAWVDEHNELHGGQQYRIAPLYAAAPAAPQQEVKNV